MEKKWKNVLSRGSFSSIDHYLLMQNGNSRKKLTP